MKKLVVVVAFLFAVSALPMVAMAGESNPWMDQPTPGKQAWQKLVYGLTNVVFGWTEIFQEPFEAYHEKKEGTRWINVVTGFAGGIVYAITDTVGGALDAVSFPATDLSIQLPEGGVKCPFAKS